jgi:hypothetical protein
MRHIGSIGSVVRPPPIPCQPRTPVRIVEGMAERFKTHDMQTLIRSAAMAPLDPQTVRRVLDEHEQLLREQEALAGLLRRLTPACDEVRAALNELARMVSET